MDTTSQPSQGLAPQKGMDLPRIQTSFRTNSSDRNQPPMLSRSVDNEKLQDQPDLAEKAPAIKRRLSRASLQNLFTRSRPTSVKSSKPVGQLDAHREEPEVRDEHTIASNKAGRNSISKEKPPVQVPLTTPTPKLKHRNSKSALRSEIKNKNHPVRNSMTWNPPPLFQAYPQAVKHGRLTTPALSADAILRFNDSKRVEAKTLGSVLSPQDTDVTDTASTGPKSNEEIHNKHRRQNSGSTSTCEWTEKVYVLVTSGYILQYAGEGSFDRRPEKVLQLGESSAAFACDAIHGKHWVLRVSRFSGEDGTVSSGSKSLFSKLPFRGDSKRSTSNFLLVLGSPEEMDSWLVAVRKEIEALGGKQYLPDVGKRRPTNEALRALQEKQNRRFVIKRDPTQFSRHGSPPLGTRSGDESRDVRWTKPVVNVPSPHPAMRDSVANRRSMDSPSISFTTVSTDQAYLDRVRDSSRMSYSSAGAKTLTTSERSSPGPSPARANFNLDVLPSNFGGIATTTATYPNTRRRPMQAIPKQVESRPMSPDYHSSPRSPRSQSFYSSSRARSISPAAPSLSAPSFSKRYSEMSIPALSTPPTSITVHSSPRSSRDESEPLERPTSFIGKLPSSTTLGAKLTRRRISLSAEAGAALSTLATFSQNDEHFSASQASQSASDQTIPRRFSSLEYSRGVSPCRLPYQTPSPHPPPTAALPALPASCISVTDQDQGRRPTSASSAQFRKLRRPNSMQVHSDPLPIQSTSQVSFDGGDRTLQSSPSTTIKTTHNTTRLSLQPPKMQVHRSMPHVGLPSAPPEYPLPMLPPTSISSSSSRDAKDGNWKTPDLAGRYSFQSVRAS
ncbi:hypothetical protein MMC12_005257 [Toensbergia leucococca]|nr:hypothetical protein [Toensbergia leucococca]